MEMNLGRRGKERVLAVLMKHDPDISDINTCSYK